jgi:hypothetical protein
MNFGPPGFLPNTDSQVLALFFLALAQIALPDFPQSNFIMLPKGR